MSTDASKFSLEKLTETFKPCLDALSFKKLDDYFIGGVRDTIEGIPYHLRLYPSVTDSKMIVTPNDLVYLVPV